MAAVQIPNGTLPNGTIPHAIEQWALWNFFKIIDAKELEGGWEHWVQVELALLLGLPQNAGNNYNLVREEPWIWHNAPGDIIDLWLARTQQNALADNIGVELKCRTARENSIVNRFIRDCVKIARPAANGLPRPGHGLITRVPAAFWAVALTFDAQDTQGPFTVANNMPANNPNPVYYYEISPPNWIGSLYMIFQHT